MGTIPVGPTFTAGQKLTAANLNAMNDAQVFWALTPRCYAYQGSAQTLTTGVSTLITFDSEVYDIVQSGDTPAHDNTTNNSRIFARTTGKYDIRAQVMFGNNATGSRILQVRLNSAGSSVGGTQIAQTSQGAVSGASTSVPLLIPSYPLSAGDYIELFASQASGGNLALNVGQMNTFLGIRLDGS